MMVSFTSLYSGSDKNSSVFKYKNTTLLIDCGGSLKSLKEQLEKVDLSIDEIDAVLLTHTHTDHLSALKMIIKHTSIPVYASLGSHEEIFDSGVDMNKERRIIIDENTVFGIKDIYVEAFKTPHDTNCSFGYNLFFNNKTASFATDLGHIPNNFIKTVKGRDFVLLESNHDVNMLKKLNRPESIIKRILGNNGHLSNELSAEFSLELIKDGLKNLMLGHLSGEANTSTLAYEVTLNKLKNHGIDAGIDITLNVAPRGMLSKTVNF